MGDYIRFFASTDGGAVSKVALEYVRSLVRAAPIRLISVSGGVLSPDWRVFERLLGTDMSGKMLANVVCTEPHHWIRELRIPMPTQDPRDVALRTGKTDHEPPKEVARDTVELYTSGERNVLIMGTLAKSEAQTRAAMRYEVRIYLTEAPDGLAFAPVTGTHYVMGLPVAHHGALKTAVIGS